MADTARRLDHPLDGPWRYRPDHPLFAYGDSLGWSRASFSDLEWPMMSVPACWEIADPTLLGFEGLVWFRRRFRTPSSPDATVTLRFEAVNYRADVWLNDTYLGSHEGGFTPFGFRVEHLVRERDENVLVVRVDNVTQPDRVPGASYGWWNYGGIYRSATLQERPPAHVADVWVDTRPLDRGASGRALAAIHVAVVNHGFSAFSGHIEFELCGLTWEAPVDLAPGTIAELDETLEIPSVGYWSPRRPVLHTATVSLMAGKLTIDATELTIGVRRLEVDGSRVLLNGEPIKLAGFNRHEEYPGTGRAHDENQMQADLRAIKASGANFLRAAHYPHHPRLYEACDRLGLMVMDEIPVYWPGTDANPVGNGGALATARTMLEEMILRDRNHPCVVIWCVSNETIGGRAEIDAGNAALLKHARALDPSRLVSHAILSAAWALRDDQAMPQDDILCLNEYFGFRDYPRVVRSDADLEAVVAEAMRELDRLHERVSDRPVLISKFGGHGLPGHHGDFPLSEEWQVKKIRAHWEALVSRPYVAGALIGAWHDYRLNRRGAAPVTTEYMGVYTHDRRPKLAASLVRGLFSTYLGEVAEAAPVPCL